MAAVDKISFWRHCVKFWAILLENGTDINVSKDS